MPGPPQREGPFSRGRAGVVQLSLALCDASAAVNWIPCGACVSFSPYICFVCARARARVSRLGLALSVSPCVGYASLAVPGRLSSRP